MIVTSVIVLTIVGSAIAFKVKGGRFCILTTSDPLNTDNCTTYTESKKITTSIAGIQWKYAPCWDQDATTCTAANNHLCTATFRLVGNQ
jgi:hypothetical protein